MSQKCRGHPQVLSVSLVGGMVVVGLVGGRSVWLRWSVGLVGWWITDTTRLTWVCESSGGSHFHCPLGQISHSVFPTTDFRSARSEDR